MILIFQAPFEIDAFFYSNELAIIFLFTITKKGDHLPSNQVLSCFSFLSGPLSKFNTVST